MPKLILTIGPSASGKTCWVYEFIINKPDWVNLNRDDIRFELFTNGVRDWRNYKFNKQNEQRVTEKIEMLRDNPKTKNFNIVVSDTNLNPKYRLAWKEWAEQNNYDYEEKLFHCDWDELVRRNNQREGGIPESVLFSQFKQFMRQYGLIGDNAVIVHKDNLLLPNTIIVDIDGTVAKTNGRGHFDWSKVGTDIPRKEIIKMVLAVSQQTKHITFMSGRDGCCYNDTFDWIKRFVMSDVGINWDLVMRKEGDMRKDWIVKYELYLANVHEKFNVSAVFDDRPAVIRMWTILNLPNIVQVGEYGHEF